MSYTLTLTSEENLARGPNNQTPDDEYHLAGSYDRSLDTTKITFDSPDQGLDDQAGLTGRIPGSSDRIPYENSAGEPITEDQIQTADVEYDGQTYEDVKIVTGAQSRTIWGTADNNQHEQLTNANFTIQPIWAELTPGNWQMIGYASTGMSIEEATNTAPGADTATTPNSKDGLTASSFVPCFVTGTLIQTQNGVRSIEELSVGDMVLTRDNGLQPIRWIGSKQLSPEALEQNPNLRPIRIRAGALGACTPSSDLLVSPQHRVLVRSKIAIRMFGAEEVLVAAKQLLQKEGIDYAEDLTEVAYYHFLFDRHEVVFSNGAETESLYTGSQALKSVGEAAKEEILTLFPQLKETDYVPESARPLPSGRQARKLASRHIERNRSFVQ